MPVRKIPKYGAGRKNLGKFASVKTGRVAWYESLLERDYMYLLDYECDVTYWHEQPLRIRFSYGGKVHRYTPDLEVLRASRKQLIEVKPKHKVDSGEWDVLFRAASSVCEQEGYDFLVLTDEVIRMQPRLENVKLLWKYARTPVLPQHQIMCSQFFQTRKDEPVTLGDLIQLFTNKQLPKQTLYCLLFWGALDFDLMQPLDQDSRILLPSSSAITAVKRRASYYAPAQTQ
ncbi:MAG TPA: TnsA endonuclease N-terminal domain-containing protein [Pyrinomonadaceae bacterium]|nr:TnsA endonuclease N-terminal domain-containing protein [Pyrinomonadaceae bacterium]